MKKCLSVALVAFFVSIASLNAAPSDNRPQGFRFFNNHLTIKPYVSVSYGYDNNIDTTNKKYGDSIFFIKPGATFLWRGERWALTGSLYYQYNSYVKYHNEDTARSYGESLEYMWSNVGESDHKGWNLMLSERYAYIAQSDAFGADNGRGIWRTRQQFDFAGALERRINDRLHASVSGQYNWLDYLRDQDRYGDLYGWSSYAIGAEVGYVMSKWTDLLLDVGYTSYSHKQSYTRNGHHLDDNSESYSVMAGVGTHATEKISYRVLMGMSQFNYAGNGNTDSGWTYSLDAKWDITRTFRWAITGKSYYMPSERQLGSANKTYTISTGVSWLTMGDRLNLNANIAWRNEHVVYNDFYAASGKSYDEDIFSGRLGASYTVNRWVSVFANLTYEQEFCTHHDYEYDRLRGIVGLNFHY